MESKGGPAWNAIVELLRSVQAYMAKVLGPMVKTDPEAAQVIVDTVELLSYRPFHTTEESAGGSQCLRCSR